MKKYVKFSPNNNSKKDICRVDLETFVVRQLSSCYLKRGLFKFYFEFFSFVFPI